MADTSRERYAVVSCHVERPLDDAVWARFAKLQQRRPAGFAIAALLRPADAAAGEDEELWVDRAGEAALRGPLGHHTHWTAPDHARPTSAGTGERVREEGRQLRELGLTPTCFCGGGWYTDTDVVEACAELGYVDCTPRSSRPAYLHDGDTWASLGAPARIELPSGRRLLALPTTHSLGDLARDVFPRRWQGRMPRRIDTGRARATLPQFVHVYFHDTDLLDRRRRALLRFVLAALARRATPTTIDALAASIAEEAPEISWNDVFRL